MVMVNLNSAGIGGRRLAPSAKGSAVAEFPGKATPHPFLFFIDTMRAHPTCEL